MSEIIKAIIVGLIQGLTEFLPVSSSGHIELAKEILSLDLEGEENLLFTLVLHTATALSTIFVFRKKIGEIIKGIFKGEKEHLLFAGKIILSMIPAALIGLLLKDQIEALFSGNIRLVGMMLIVTAVLLYFADKAKKTRVEVTFPKALLIGISQAIAILPGISRSGATISTSVLLGVDRSKSAFFSFLMVIPLIFGAMAKDLLDGGDTLSFTLNDSAYLIAGFFAAFFSGIFACNWMMELVKKAQLSYFSIYCVVVGLAAITYSFM